MKTTAPQQASEPQPCHSCLSPQSLQEAGLCQRARPAGLSRKAGVTSDREDPGAHRSLGFRELALAPALQYDLLPLAALPSLPFRLV